MTLGWVFAAFNNEARRETTVKFTRDQNHALTVRRVDRGSIRIGDEDFEQSIGLGADGAVYPLSNASLNAAEITEGDLATLLDTTPEIVLIGTGWTAARPPSELTFAMARRQVGLEVMDTPAACRTFNILVAEGRRVAALILLN